MADGAATAIDLSRQAGLRTTAPIAVALLPVLAAVLWVAGGAGSLPSIGLAALVCTVLVVAARPALGHVARSPLLVPAVVLLLTAMVVLAPPALVPGLSLLWPGVAIAVSFLSPGRRGVVDLVLALVGLVVSVLATAMEPLVVALDVGVYLAVVVMVRPAATELVAAMLEGHAATVADATADRLLTSLGALTTLDRTQVLTHLVASVRELGLDDAGVWLVATRRPEAAVGDRTLLRRVLRAGQHEARPDHRLVVDGRAALVVALRHDGVDTAHLVAVAGDDGLRTWQHDTVVALAQLAERSLEAGRAVREREEVVRRLTDLDRRQNDFVSSVSHELRTPLTIVGGLAETLVVRDADPAEPRTVQLVDRLVANAERLGEMVETLLDTSQLRSGSLRPAFTAVQVGAVMRAAVDRLASLTGGHDVQVSAADGLWVRADPRLLDHVLENLLVNASRYTPPGTRVDVTAVAVDGRVRIEVHDEGPGIPAAELPRLTDRFFRGGSPSHRPTSGLGLGLSVVADVLAAHGARLEVSSAPGQGATFAFSLEGVGAPTTGSG